MGSDLVIALEFTGLRAESSFDAAASLFDPASVFRIDPLEAHMSDIRLIPEHAAAIAGDIAQTPRFILGYCTGASLAAHLAAAFEARAGVGTHVVLFDPDRVSQSYLRAEFAILYGGLGGDPGVALARAGTSAASLLACAEAGLNGLAAGLAERYGGGTDGAEVAADLLGRYRAWLRFLAASAAAEPAVIGSPVSVVTSRSAVATDQIISSSRAPAIYHCDPAVADILSDPAAIDALREIAMT